MYTVTSSIGKWPDGSTKDFVPGCLEGMYSNVSCLETYEENFVVLEVYYEKLNYEELNESPHQSFSIMLSNLGGQIGLWLGMSIISAIEFAVLGLQLCTNLISPPTIGRFADF
jgi:amiloride-sensitive sodium channel subunit alpha/amiloride-sensitive sodium channel subunit gamma